MSELQQPTFSVSAYSDPIVVQISGKANYLNSKNLHEFIEKMAGEGKGKIVLDLEHCTGMDSTFLGILAGAAIKLSAQTPKGILIICNLNKRNHDIIHSLGLQNLLTIDEDILSPINATDKKAFSALKNAEVSDAREVLKAHENLITANEENAIKFQDVITFLKDQTE